MTLICDRSAPKHYRDEETGRTYWSASQILTTLDQHAFDDVPPWILEKARSRGSMLHQKFGLLLLSIIGLCERPAAPTNPEYHGYFQAMERFVEREKPEPILVETASKNDKDGTAGTPDGLLKLWNKLSIVDLKSGPPRRVHRVQLLIYKKLELYQDAEQLVTLYIHADGTYQAQIMKPQSSDWPAVLNALQVLNWRMAG